MMAVRVATRASTAAISRIARKRSYSGWKESDFAAELDRPDSVLLCSSEGGIATGYAAARVLGEECRLLDIASAEDGRGTGRALWAALTAAARARGCSRLTLEVSERNARARDFYARAGARVVGRRPKFYNDGSDALLMDLDL